MKGTRKEQGDIFGLSFMDCICCGFGAVILMFILTTMEETESQGTLSQDVSAEVNRAENLLAKELDALAELEEEVEALHQAVADADQEKTDAEAAVSDAQGKLDSQIEQKGARDAELRELLKEREAKSAQLTSILAEVASPVEGVASTGKAVSPFEGDGRRHFVTGMKIDGNRALFLVDASASMLADTVSEVRQLARIQDPAELVSRKWLRTLDSLDWLFATMESRFFQVMLFNETTKKVLSAPSGDWMRAGDPQKINEVSSELWNSLPSGGSNLEAALQAAARLSPKPDVIYLITDSLPTHSSQKITGSQASGSDRVQHFLSTTDEIEALRVPINIILFHFEGDPAAGGYYWRMANASRGSLFSPSSDWPN